MNPTTTVLSDIGLFLLLGLGLMGVLVIVTVSAIFLSKAPAARIIAGILAVMVIGILLVVFAWSFFRLRPEYVTVDPVVERPAPAEMPTVGHPWNYVTEEAMEASLFSSVNSAGRALARSCIQALQSRLAENPSEIRLVISDSLAENVPSLETDLASYIRESFPLSQVSRVRMSEAGKHAAEILVLQVDAPHLLTENNAPWDESQSFIRGDLRMSCRYQDLDFEDQKQFTEKPWVEQFDGFVNERPGRQFITAGSSRFALNEREASQNARRVAAGILGPMIADSAGVTRSREVDDLVVRALDRDHLIIDQFSQKLQISAGEVWRTRLLIDARPESLASIVSGRRTAARELALRRNASVLGIMTLIGLTLLLYYVMNELTKGYFVWSLRFTTMLTILVLAVAFCWWMNITA